MRGGVGEAVKAVAVISASVGRGAAGIAPADRSLLLGLSLVYLFRHTRECGYPVSSESLWIPADAGMTESESPTNFPYPTRLCDFPRSPPPAAPSSPHPSSAARHPPGAQVPNFGGLRRAAGRAGQQIIKVASQLPAHRQRRAGRRATTPVSAGGYQRMTAGPAQRRSQWMRSNPYRQGVMPASQPRWRGGSGGN